MTTPDTPVDLTRAELPDGVAALEVAPFLLRAGISRGVADHLEYIIDQVYFEGTERRERWIRFVILIALSTMIASFGLLSDSVAVVIGAMLVAPLMTPILGIAVSVVLTEYKRLVGSGLTVLVGAVEAIAMGWLITAFAGGKLTPTSLPGEVLSRTSPGLLDLGIAIAAGLTAGYLMVDRKAAASAAGVAIAVALVPPLATVGICAEVQAWSLAAGALLLFATNFAAIILSAASVIVASRILPSGFIRERFIELRKGFAAVVVAVVVVSVPLAIHTARAVEKSQFERLVTRAVADWDPRATIVGLDTRTEGTWYVNVRVEVPEDPSRTSLLAKMISDRSGRAIDLDVGYSTQRIERAATR